jgi:hypothetical protein
MLAPTLPDLSRLDREGLQTLLLAEHQERIATHQQLLQREQQLLERESEIETLKLLLSQLRRMQFGRKSEKLERRSNNWNCGWKICNWRKQPRKPPRLVLQNLPRRLRR